MTYNSTSEIKKDFQIDSDSLEVIRDSVNAVRINTHPDKTNGEFPDENIKELYYKANSAIEYLDGIKSNQSLIVVEKMTDLMKVVTELIPANRQNSLEQNLDSKISFAISTFRSKMFLPKISLTAITAVVTFLFLFPGQIKDNPTLSHFINPTSSFFAIVWFSLLLYSGLFWMMTFNNEEKSKKKLMLLKVDSVQNRIFENFMERHLTDDKFKKDELTHFIYESCMGNRLGELHRSEGLNLITTRLFGSEIITMEIAQNIAELIISRGEKNKVIEKLSINTLSDTYELKNYR
ncbi:hypothetical protein EQG63_12070 [Flavobacterium amnicola]|uniref:J domain-containing protein n=1 Tax=Flavobacterium amnicola TaxID=2506422 RepID=A0A4Q1JZP6_9FLAO|nr:hypothetical protein [Flavobacterium amnicola]RXR15969.1 hypothetical protein EQG63_12070 [Flavobacterium amnicola]